MHLHSVFICEWIFFSHVETKHGKFCSFNVTSISFCATGNYQVDSNENSTSVNNAHSIKSFLYFIFCLLSKSFLVFLSLGIIVCFSTSYCHKFLQCGMNKSLKSHKKFFPHCFIWLALHAQVEPKHCTSNHVKLAPPHTEILTCENQRKPHVNLIFSHIFTVKISFSLVVCVCSDVTGFRRMDSTLFSPWQFLYGFISRLVSVLHISITEAGQKRKKKKDHSSQQLALITYIIAQPW